jgi:putative flippase GtrA
MLPCRACLWRRALMPLRREILIFLLVGGAAVAIDALVYSGALVAGVPTAFAKAAGFCAGALWAYQANMRLTFRTSCGRPLAFLLLYAATLSLNVALNAGTLTLLASLGAAQSVALAAAFLAATGASAAANFLGLRLVVFRNA